jgi:sugar phosphate isomerase/epimerase
MKFAFSSNAFTRYNLIETIKIISSLGYKGIEIMADVPHAYPKQLTSSDISEIHQVLNENGLAVSNVNAFMHHADGDTYHPSWIEEDPNLRAKRVSYTLDCIDLARDLGATCISTEPGGPLDGLSRNLGLEMFKEGLAKVGPSAREKGIRILIEPEPGLLIENSTQFLELFAELDPDVFGINFDVGHFFCVGENVSDLIRRMQQYIHHFHLEDIAATREHRHLMLGDGAIDLEDVLATIKEINYSGFITVELYTYAHAAVDSATSAMEYLKKLTQRLQH